MVKQKNDLYHMQKKLR